MVFSAFSTNFFVFTVFCHVAAYMALITTEYGLQRIALLLIDEFGYHIATDSASGAFLAFFLTSAPV